MIGALVMRKVMSGSQAATVNAKDIEALKKFWADDVKLTFVGQPPIEGKDAVEAWYRSWFAGIKEIQETSTNFALVHPYALGASNTVLFEALSSPTVGASSSPRSQSSRSVEGRPRVSGSTSPTMTVVRC